MRNNSRWNTITACGEDCTDCAKRAQGLCNGCRETDGYCLEWKQTGRCPVHACVREHDALFCGQCSEFPCEKLPLLMPWKTDAAAHLEALAQAWRQENRGSIVSGLL